MQLTVSAYFDDTDNERIFVYAACSHTNLIIMACYRTHRSVSNLLQHMIEQMLV